MKVTETKKVKFDNVELKEALAMYIEAELGDGISAGDIEKVTVSNKGVEFVYTIEGE